MVDQSLQFNEIVHIRKRYPEKVFLERQDIHHFYWRWEASSIINGGEPDFEPILMDKERKIAISRYHWETLVAWISPVYHTEKPIAEFHTDNHIPVVLLKMGGYRRIGSISDPFAKFYFERFFLRFIQKMLKGEYDYRSGVLNGYERIVDYTAIGERPKLLGKNYNCIVMAGDTRKEKLAALQSMLYELGVMIRIV